MHPAVEAALKDWRILNTPGFGWWATFEAIQFEDEHPVVRLTYGTMHHNGFKECALRTVQYHLHKDGTIGVF